MLVFMGRPALRFFVVRSGGLLQNDTGSAMPGNPSKPSMQDTRLLAIAPQTCCPEYVPVKTRVLRPEWSSILLLSQRTSLELFRRVWISAWQT